MNSIYSIKKILIVEDDEDFSDSYSYWFKDFGVEIVRAYDGSSALNMLREDKEIGLLVLDYKLPIKNGIEVLEEIFDNNIKIPTILVSGYIEDFKKHFRIHCSITKQKLDDVLFDLKIGILEKTGITKEKLVKALINVFSSINISKELKELDKIKERRQLAIKELSRNCLNLQKDILSE